MIASMISMKQKLSVVLLVLVVTIATGGQGVEPPTELLTSGSSCCRIALHASRQVDISTEGTPR